MKKFLKDYPGVIVLAAAFILVGILGGLQGAAPAPAVSTPATQTEPAYDAEAQAEAQKETESLALITQGAQDNLARLCPGERVGQLANAIRMSSNALLEFQGVSIQPNKYALMVMEAKGRPETASFSCNDLVDIISREVTR